MQENTNKVDYNTIETYFLNIDTKIIHTLEEGIQLYGNNLKTISFMYQNEIKKLSSETDLSLSAFDYLMSKVKELYLHNLLFEITLLEENKARKKNYTNADRYSSKLVLDITSKNIKHPSNKQISDMKYGILEENNPKEFAYSQNLFKKYQTALLRIGHDSLNEYLDKNYSYSTLSSFKDNITFTFDPSIYKKKDMAFLYADATSYLKKVKKTTHKYLQYFPNSNFFYIAFLINSFNTKITAFKTPSVFFNNLHRYDFPQYNKNTGKQKSASQIHEKNNRDFKWIIDKYNTHIDSANTYRHKLIETLCENKKELFEFEDGHINYVPILNYYFLVNNDLRSDFFSSLDSPFIQDITKKISIKELYENIIIEKDNTDINSCSIYPCSINYCVKKNPELVSNANNLFYLNLLELLMLFNVDTEILSNYYFYLPKTINSQSNYSNCTYLIDSFEIYKILQKIILDFLNKAYSMILDFLQEGIKLYNQIESNKESLNYFIFKIQDFLIKKYDIDYNFSDSTITNIDFKTIKEETIKVYKEKIPNKQLVICYLFNSCARNRIILDYFYKLNPTSKGYFKERKKKKE